MPLDNSQKKLKQARLPFSPVDSKSQKKRKNSNDLETEKSSKLLKSDDFTAENVIKGLSNETDSIEEKKEEEFEEKENIKLSNKLNNIRDSSFVPEKETENNEVVLLEDSSEDEKNSHQSGNKDKPKKNAKIDSKRKRRSKRNATPKNEMNSSLQEMFKQIEIKKKKNPPQKKDSSNQEVIDIDEDSNNAGISKDQTKLNESSENDHYHEVSSDKESADEAKLSHDSDDSCENLSSSLAISQESDLSEGEKEKEGSTPNTSSVQTKAPLKKRKLTPGQQLKYEQMKKKQEERMKIKMEKDKLRKEQEEDKFKEREERKRKKIEEKEAKEKEKEEKRLNREEERLKKEEKKEEERLKKVEEKQKKEEEKIQAEEEEREKQKKLKAKFAQFFVPKKLETAQPQEMETTQGNFILFQVKENMKVAPLVRNTLSNEKREKLDETLSCGGKMETSPAKYLKEIKTKGYVIGRSAKTFPPIEKSEYDDDDCEILDEEDDEIDDTSLFEETKPSQVKSIVRAKFLKFCENNRPAYYGTWSKKPTRLGGRKPFVKEVIFDYDYDSDEDWEEIENGESLSDSDGEGDEGTEEEVNQYEVDNEFFVPHGYLSDGEGEEDDDDDGGNNIEGDGQEKKDETLQKEKLKLKQEEFELELKQKTKNLKPKVFGCVWLGDKSSHKAYDQLLNLLTPHRAIMMFGSCPVNLDTKDCNNDDLKEGEEEEETSKKFVKSFPEKAIPDLIRLIHGNRHSKLFLMREFSEYWKKKNEDTGDNSPNSSGYIALRKIEPKIQEIGQYGKCSEDGISSKYRVWYVSKELRSKYGLEDLSLANSWSYTLPPKSKKNDSKEEKVEETEEGGSKCQMKSPCPNRNLITKFTKVLNVEEEKRKFISLSQAASENETTSSGIVTPKRSARATKADITPTLDKTGKKKKKKISLTPVSKEKEHTLPQKPRNSITSFFKNMERSCKGENSKESHHSSDKSDSDGIIVLD